MSNSDLPEVRIQHWRQRTDRVLEKSLPSSDTTPPRLHQAMRYAVFNGGKRVRPILTYAAGYAVGVSDEALDAAACAVELIHAYSLVHDDLPVMDDDDLRRGQPTCHRAFDEATAVLAGDALQSLAFHILARKERKEDNHPATQQLKMLDVLAIASGSRGMAGGQAIDIESEGRHLNVAELENMHIHKTGALIRASVKLGALCQSNIESTRLKKLDHFAKCIGLAFQIQDDILDVEGDTGTLGKHQGADQARNKPTYPALVGLDSARAMARELHQDALASLAEFGEPAAPLAWIADYIIKRNH